MQTPGALSLSYSLSSSPVHPLLLPACIILPPLSLSSFVIIKRSNSLLNLFFFLSLFIISGLTSFSSSIQCLFLPTVYSSLPPPFLHITFMWLLHVSFSQLVLMTFEGCYWTFSTHFLTFADLNYSIISSEGGANTLAPVIWLLKMFHKSMIVAPDTHCNGHILLSRTLKLHLL